MQAELLETRDLIKRDFHKWRKEPPGETWCVSQKRRIEHQTSQIGPSFFKVNCQLVICISRSLWEGPLRKVYFSMQSTSKHEKYIIILCKRLYIEHVSISSTYLHIHWLFDTSCFFAFDLHVCLEAPCGSRATGLRPGPWSQLFCRGAKTETESEAAGVLWVLVKGWWKRRQTSKIPKSFFFWFFEIWDFFVFFESCLEKASQLASSEMPEKRRSFSFKMLQPFWRYGGFGCKRDVLQSAFSQGLAKQMPDLLLEKGYVWLPGFGAAWDDQRPAWSDHLKTENPTRTTGWVHLFSKWDLFFQIVFIVFSLVILKVFFRQKVPEKVSWPRSPHTSCSLREPVLGCWGHWSSWRSTLCVCRWSSLGERAG